MRRQHCVLVPPFVEVSEVLESVLFVGSVDVLVSAETSLSHSHDVPLAVIVVCAKDAARRISRNKSCSLTVAGVRCVVRVGCGRHLHHSRAEVTGVQQCECSIRTTSGLVVVKHSKLRYGNYCPISD